MAIYCNAGVHFVVANPECVEFQNSFLSNQRPLKSDGLASKKNIFVKTEAFFRLVWCQFTNSFTNDFRNPRLRQECGISFNITEIQHSACGFLDLLNNAKTFTYGFEKSAIALFALAQLHVKFLRRYLRVSRIGYQTKLGIAFPIFSFSSTQSHCLTRFARIPQRLA